MIKAIIFDFDGVIVESVNIKLDAFAYMYRAHGNDVVDKVVTHHLANGGMSRFDKFRLYHKEYLGQDLAGNELSQLADEFSHLVVDKVVAAPYVRGAFELLSKYHNIYDFYVSTGTPEAEIVRILEAKQLIGFFRGVYGSPEKKSEHASRILRNGHYRRNEVVFVGNSLSDRDAARENNIPFIVRLAEKNGQLESEKVTISIFENFGEKIKELIV